MSDWREPDDWSGIDWPRYTRDHRGPTKARLRVDYGAGECEVAGRAYLVEDDDGPALVFSDVGGWATQYVKAWKVSTAEQDEIDEQEERDSEGSARHQ